MEETLQVKRIDRVLEEVSFRVRKDVCSPFKAVHDHENTSQKRSEFSMAYGIMRNIIG
jgi:hypothetical protein